MFDDRHHGLRLSFPVFFSVFLRQLGSIDLDWSGQGILKQMTGGFLRRWGASIELKTPTGMKSFPQIQDTFCWMVAVWWLLCSAPHPWMMCFSAEHQRNFLDLLPYSTITKFWTLPYHMTIQHNCSSWSAVVTASGKARRRRACVACCIASFRWWRRANMLKLPGKTVGKSSGKSWIVDFPTRHVWLPQGSLSFFSTCHITLFFWHLEKCVLWPGRFQFQ